MIMSSSSVEIPSSSSPPKGGREKHSIVSQLEGALLISKNIFPYFMLIAFEAGGPFRAMVLLLVSPIIWFLEFVRFEDASLGVMIFVSTFGLRVVDIDAVAKATLPRFFLEDLRESAYRVFSRCGGKKHVMTCIPRIMVEPFLRGYLDVDHIIGTEVGVSSGGYCTGLVTSKGVMRSGGGTLEIMRASIRDGKEEEIDIGLGHGLRDHSFMSLCRELHLISPEEKPSALSRNEYPKPLIFHDGRFVALPTVTESIAVAVWLPLGILNAIIRILIGIILPYKLTPMSCAATGLRIRVQFPATSATTDITGNSKLYVCSHRTLLDPIFISIALRHRVSAVTYSLSRLSELISPIPTTRLTRDRSLDSETMRSLLGRGDLLVCPEGTTCREPYLLRFSPLFAEITEEIVPVAVTAEGSMFYGTTVRGYKCLDSFFFLMNPTPLYRMLFLNDDSGTTTTSTTTSTKNSCEVANRIQRSIGDALGFECTNLTRKDKYRMLAGNDGVDLRCNKTP